MRTVITLALFMCAVSARANEADRVQDQIQRCMTFPVAWTDNALKATLELKLDDAGKINNLTVVSYSPPSMNVDELRLTALRVLKNCPPLHVTTGPVRINLDLTEMR